MRALAEAREIFDAATDETSYRTAASRAYFATFNFMIERAVADGFERENRGTDHGRLLVFLMARSGSLDYRIGRRLKTMRSIRAHADYQTKLTFTRSQAQDVLEMAEEVILDWCGEAE